MLNFSLFVEELLLLADEYGDDNFKSICEKSIKRDIKADKVAEILAIIRKIKSCQVFIFDFDNGGSYDDTCMPN